MAADQPGAAPWFRKKRWWVVGGLVVLAIIDSATGSGSNKTPVSAAGTTSTSAAPTTAAPSTTTTTEEDDLGGAGAPTIAGSVVPAGAGSVTGSSACRTGAPLANVYHPNRLTVVNPCMTVSGTVESVRTESDGDTHFDLALDSQYSSLLKPANVSAQHGWLVAEIVPADKPGCTPGQPPRPASGTYDYGTCTGADEVTPSLGQHVYVTGPYVIDEDHGGWAEIHPAWAVSTRQPAAPSPATTQAPAPTTTAAPATTMAPTTTAAKTYRAGEFCSPPGATTTDANGSLMTCRQASDGRYRWEH